LSRMMAVPDADVAILQNHETHKRDLNKKKIHHNMAAHRPIGPFLGCCRSEGKKKFSE